MIEATVNFHDEAPPPLTYTFRTTYIEYTEGEVVDYRGQSEPRSRTYSHYDVGR